MSLKLTLKPNVKEVLDQTILRITDLPDERCCMSTYITRYAPCGTAACIAGWIALFMGHDSHVYDHAKRALKLSDAQARYAFLMTGFNPEGTLTLNDTPYHLSIGSTWSLEFFDELPPEFRKAAMLSFLRTMRDSQLMSWPKAFEDAAKLLGGTLTWEEEPQ